MVVVVQTNSSPLPPSQILAVNRGDQGFDPSRFGEALRMTMFVGI